MLPIAFVAFLNCSGDSTTKPDEDDTPSEVASESIGPDGGSLEANGFSLIVPAGAFETTHELRLFESPADRPFGEEQVTPTFHVTGLPNGYSEPIQVFLEHDEPLLGESFVAHGDWVYDEEGADATLSYHLHEATESSGLLACELPAFQGSTSNKGSDLGDFIPLVGVTNYRTLETPHFQIKYPSYLQARIVDLADIAELAYYTVEDDLGMSFERARFGWPIRIDVVQLLPQYTVVWDDEHIQCDHPRMRINSEKVASEAAYPEISVEVGVRLLSRAITGYVGLVGVEEGWFHSAVQQWSVEKFTDDPAYRIPPAYPGKEMAPFRGMRAGAGETLLQSAHHGAGLASMIKHLADQLGYADDGEGGKSGLVLTYEALAENTDVATALITNVDALVDDWWPEYLERLIHGEIYDVPISLFLTGENLSGTWSIDDASDIEESFSGDYPDLSAKLYVVGLNDPDIDPSAKLSLDLSSDDDEGLSFIAFGHKTGSLESWGRVDGTSMEIESLRDRTEEGWKKILVAVVNSRHVAPYMDESRVELNLAVTKELLFNRAEFHAQVYAYIQHESGTGTWESEGVLAIGSHELMGSFSGNTFVGGWDGGYTQHTVEITMSGDQSAIEGITWTSRLTAENHTQEIDFVGVNIPRLDPDYYRISGVGTCNSISYVTFTDYTFAEQQALRSHECDGDSNVFVRFWTE